MRKVLFLFILATSTTCFSQEFNGAIFGGITTAQIDGDRYAGYNKLGLQLGAYVNRFLTKKTALQLGLAYKEMGSREESDDAHYKCKLQYITMPFTFRYFYYEKVDFELGVSLGYLIKQAEERDGYVIDDPVEFDKFDFSGIGGINYRLTEKLSVGVNLQYSLVQVRPYIPQNLNLKSGQYNHVLSFILAYQFSSWKQ